MDVIFKFFLESNKITRKTEEKPTFHASVIPGTFCTNDLLVCISEN